jgi:hypothetical protein
MMFCMFLMHVEICERQLTVSRSISSLTGRQLNFSARDQQRRKPKSSVEQPISIIPVGGLFHVQTCADAEVKRFDQVENKWICWYQHPGYIPLATIQQMINTFQGPLRRQEAVSYPPHTLPTNDNSDAKKRSAIHPDLTIFKAWPCPVIISVLM